MSDEPPPGITEMRSELVSECDSLGFCPDRGAAGGGAEEEGGTRKFGSRAEIDTSPPFGSVKEAVTHFGGSGPWVPCYRIGEDFGEIDLKKVEEQAAELEKDLIVKELETLDVLEELGTTKRIVEDLKLQLQKEALRCMAIPVMSSPAAVTKEMNKENSQAFQHHFYHEQQRLMGSPCCPSSSPDMILMELKQAKLNLGKTINELGVIQTSVESLNKNMKQEKTFLQNTRKRLTSKFAGVLSLEEELKQARRKPDNNVGTGYNQEQLKQMTEVTRKPEVLVNGHSKVDDLRTAELRLLAARKMEEAAKAAEAVALAEIKCISNSETSPCGFSSLPEPGKTTLFKPVSPLMHKPQKRLEPVITNKIPKYEPANSKMQILKKMREATEEVKRSKQALEDALTKIEMANRKQSAAEEALLKWIPEDDHHGLGQAAAAYYNTRLSNMHFFHPDPCQGSPLNQVKDSIVVGVEEPKPVLRSTVSMRDFLGRKQQVATEDYAAAARGKPVDGGGGGRTGRQKVALSQMLHELRDDLSFNPRPEKHETGDQKQFFTQRRKFGFIHISLPMTKPSKKKTQGLSSMMN